MSLETLDAQEWLGTEEYIFELMDELEVLALLKAQVPPERLYLVDRLESACRLRDLIVYRLGGLAFLEHTKTGGDAYG